MLTYEHLLSLSRKLIFNKSSLFFIPEACETDNGPYRFSCISSVSSLRRRGVSDRCWSKRMAMGLDWQSMFGLAFVGRGDSLTGSASSHF